MAGTTIDPGAAAAAEARAGLLGLAGCFAVWAAYPFLFKLLVSVPPLEIVAHRALWAALTLLLCLPFGGLWRRVWRAMSSPRTMLALVITASIIMSNWLAYVLAVVDNHILAASLGYFLSPLVAIAIGVVLMRERLTLGQKVAVGIAVLAVANLILRLPSFPFFSLFLAFGFSSYGAIRKKLPVDPVAGMFIECLLALPGAALYLAYIGGTGHSAFGTQGPLIDFWLIVGGVSTVFALSFFHFGAKRLNYSTIGLLMYIIPSWLFVASVWIFGEKLDPIRLLTFVMIWIALAIYSGEALLRARRSRA